MFVPKEFEPNQVLKSADINTQFRSIYGDISDLYSRNRELSNRQKLLSYVVETTYDTTRTYRDDILESSTLLNANIIVRTLYATTNVIYPTKVGIRTCNHEVDYGRATLDVDGTSRLFLAADPMTGTVVPISNLEDYVDWVSSGNRIATELSTVIETDIKEAFDPNPELFYMRKCTAESSAVTEVDLLLNINIPSGNETINSIKICPFPEGTVDITEVSYGKDTAIGQYFRSPHGTYYNYLMENSRKLAMDLEPTSISSLKLHMKQRNRKYSGPYAFFIGLHLLSLENVIYSSDAYIGFSLTRTDYNISQLTELRTNLTEEGSYLNAEYRIYTDRDEFDAISDSYVHLANSQTSQISAGNPVYITDTTDTVYVLVRLIKYASGGTPVLKYLTLKWS